MEVRIVIDYVRVEDALKTLALHGRQRFNVYQVAYLSNNPDVNEVFQYLVSREPFILTHSYELQCPNQHSTATYKDLSDISQGWRECRICAEEFVPDRNNVFVVFDFTPSYLEQISQMKQLEKKSYSLMKMN